jgi:hypothetical protein
VYQKHQFHILSLFFFKKVSLLVFLWFVIFPEAETVTNYPIPQNQG